jgi:hypothetical protein
MYIIIRIFNNFIRSEPWKYSCSNVLGAWQLDTFILSLVHSVFLRCHYNRYLGLKPITQ